MFILASVPVAPDPGPGFDFFDYSNPGNVVLLVGFLIPILTGILVKKVAHPGVKAVSTMVLSILTATVATLVGADGDWAWRAFGNAFLSTFLPAIALYYGFLKPAGVTGKVQDATANFGLLVKSRDNAPVVADPVDSGEDGNVHADVAKSGHLVHEGAAHDRELSIGALSDGALAATHRREVEEIVYETLRSQQGERDDREDHIARGDYDRAVDVDGKWVSPGAPVDPVEDNSFRSAKPGDEGRDDHKPPTPYI